MCSRRAQLENLRSKSKYTYTCDAAVQGTSPGNPAVNNAVEENCPCSFQKKINYHFSGGGYGDYDEDLCDLDEGGSCCGWGPAVYFFTNDVWPGESCSITLKGMPRQQCKTLSLNLYVGFLIVCDGIWT